MKPKLKVVIPFDANEQNWHDWLQATRQQREDDLEARMLRDAHQRSLMGNWGPHIQNMDELEET